MSENIEFAMKNGLKREEKDSCRYRKQRKNTEKKNKTLLKSNRRKARTDRIYFIYPIYFI